MELLHTWDLKSIFFTTNGNFLLIYSLWLKKQNY